MNVVITNRKAPWPEGADVGAVVEVPDPLPGCLVGKCKPAEKGAKAAHTWAPQYPTPVLCDTRIVGGPLDQPVGATATDSEDLSIAQSLLNEARIASDRMQADLIKSREQAGEALNEAAVTKAERDRFADELKAAQARIAELEAAAASHTKAKK